MEMHKYEQGGEIVLAVSSEIPGISIVPPGFRPEDAKPMTLKEHKDLEKKANQPSPQRDILAELDALKAEIKALKDKPPKA